MRPPEPRSLLVEHPALLQPFEYRETKVPPTPIGNLDRADRVRIAVQLVAFSALLGEFELWPGRSALRRAEVYSIDEGFRAVLSSPPVSLSRLWLRLGGGSGAAELTRNGVLSTVLELTALDSELFRPGGREPGFALEGVLDRLLHVLPQPLDPATARSLWMLRWSLPPIPDRGDTSLYSIPDESVAKRLAAAMWAAAVRCGEGGSLEFAAPGRKPVLVGERSGESLLRVIAGEIDPELLGALGENDAFGATVVIGRFPDGWNPPRAKVFDESRLGAHLAVVGMPLSHRVRWLDERSGRFDPYSAVDRGAITRSASRLFSKPPSRRRGRFAELIRVAALVPEGVPVARAMKIAEVDEAQLAAAATAGAVMIRNDRVLSPNPVGLGVDPLHGEVLDLFDGDDPRRLLHAALTAGDTGEILPWVRGELDRLGARGVRRVLSELQPGALGPGVQVALAEACLSLADIHGAEEALRGLAPEVKQPWVNWLDLIDRPADLKVAFPGAADFRQAPRACAEVALICIRRAKRWESEDVSGMVKSVREAMALLDGAARRWIEIRLAAQVEPDRLDDRQWRRRVAGSHPELVGLVLFERSIRAMKKGPRKLARRLLQRLVAAERSPGKAAPMHVNLGALAFDDGRDRTAEAHTLRALRLFQAAGFRRRTWEVLLNLAVTDIDHLRVEKAAERLDLVSEGQGGLEVAVERARLALAVGDLDSFSARLRDLPELRELGDSRLLIALSFLHGVERLLFDSPEAAESLLIEGGQEALAWLDLGAAVRGEPTPQSVIENGEEDGWGIRRTAELVRLSRRPGFERLGGELDGSSMDLADAMAVAVFRFLAIRRDWPTRRLRSRVARVLAQGGLAGWASRVRWEGWELEELLRALEAVVQGRASEELSGAQEADLLALLGVDGVVVRSKADGGELWRIGAGEALSSQFRGRLEFCPLGSGPPEGVGWDLVTGLLELILPIGGDGPRPRNEGDVRLDGESTALENLKEEIRQAAGTLYTVLVYGETGSGKEVVAKEIHRLSGRGGKLVSVNVAAVPVNLLEAELFGSLKGAFTGADRSRRGLVAAADGGTLFLDEVGDLDPALQVKLLRFLESGEVRPVGSDLTSTMDVRVICATHRNLERRVREGRFRQDLYFRIALGKVIVPSLRTRREDIPILKEIFEREASERHRLPISPWSRAADDLLMNHSWPGNVRELKHTVEAAMARAAGRTIGPEHLPMIEKSIAPSGTWNETLAEFKKELLAEVLTRHRGNRSAAARELGISRQALLYQLKTLGLREL